MTVVYVIFELIILTLLVGLLLPNNRMVEKSTVLPVPQDTIFNLITDNKNWKWRRNIKRVLNLENESGIEMFKEIPKKGKPITFRVKKKVPCSEYEIEIVKSIGFKGYWKGLFEKTGEGNTKITFIECTIIKNPFYKVISYLFFSLEEVIEQYFEDMANFLQENREGNLFLVKNDVEL